MGPSFLRSRRDRGFTLVEILVVLVIVGILVAMTLVLTRGLTAAQKRSLTATRMAAVDAALLQFVMLNKRLPCPANGTIASGAVGAGVEAGGDAVPCTAAQAGGVVPWVTIGIAELDATDAWDRRFTYRVAAPLTQSGVLNMSFCDPAGLNNDPVQSNGSACNVACTSGSLGKCTPPLVYLRTRGLQVQSTTGAVQMSPAAGSGAAYVVISAGESGGGAYLNTGALASTTTTDGTEEQKNYANLALRSDYIDDGIVDVAGASHFDDLVSRPSIFTLLTKAALGPRSH